MLTLLLALLVLPVSSCEDPAPTYGRATECEVRELSLPATDVLTVENRVSGGIEVVGWDRDEIRVVAIVRAYGTNGRSPAELLAATTIETDGNRIENVTAGGGWVEVRYKLYVPHHIDLTADTNNGALAVTGVTGTLDLDTNNGTVRLADIGGDVTARTSNGDVLVTASGTTWDGTGLRVSTSNGNVRLTVPGYYAAVVEAETRYGNVGARMPGIHAASETSRFYLGAGGPTLRLRTSHGDVQVVQV
ncbi:MAG: DUF4097 family beta strand repeat-containing protein [Bacteroidota bacterium]